MAHDRADRRAIFSPIPLIPTLKRHKTMSYSIDLSGRVALVTGASSGLGAQFARTLSQAGAGVVLAARRVERLKTLRAEIESQGGDAHVVELDPIRP